MKQQETTHLLQNDDAPYPLSQLAEDLKTNQAVRVLGAFENISQVERWSENPEGEFIIDNNKRADRSFDNETIWNL